MVYQTWMVTLCNKEYLINSKFDNVGIGDNTAVSDDDEFINSIVNNLTTFVNTGKCNSYLSQSAKSCESYD